MADKPISQYTKETSVLLLMALGKNLSRLDRQLSPSLVYLPPDPEHEQELRRRIGELSEELVSLASFPAQGSFRKLLGMRKDERADLNVIRTLAVVCHESLLSDRGLTVCRLARQAGMDDPETCLEARRRIYGMVAGGKLLNHLDGDCMDDSTVVPGPSLVRHIRSAKSQLHPPVWTRESMKADIERHREMLGKAKQKKISRASPQPATRPPTNPNRLLSAKEIHSLLSRHIVGDSATPILRRYASRLAMHMRRAEILARGEDPGTPPEAILIGGEPGVGKTFLVQTTARALSVPVGSISSADITADGFVGLKVSDCITALIRSAGGQNAHGGIANYDEWDKVRATRSKDGGLDVYGAAVQFGVLQLMTGQEDYELNSRHRFDGPSKVVDTRSFCYLFTGAHSGLRELLIEEQKKSVGMGFGDENTSGQRFDDIRSALCIWGMKEEFVSRLTAVLWMEPPSVEDLIRQATEEPYGVISTYGRTLKSFGINLSFTRQAVLEMAGWAKESKAYCRGLKAIVSAVAEEAVYDGSAHEIRYGVEDVRRAISTFDVSV